ncbi:LpxI family protein [Neomegalonema perideroedes]|uniref:LpxI family protein n=1 Tax=Neomegalonema perideroedes TaxID=217219 RepID=UPI000369B967|nr:UDP-2,3-diacylglucosamine diphosphatase LpxI [Neomegalonema perideroedes]
MTPAPEKSAVLGLIAGSGALPQEIAEARRAAGDPYFILALEGACGVWAEAHPHERLPVGRAGAIFAALRRAGVRRVAFAGGFLRPRLRGLRFDWTGLRTALRVARLLRRGDDGLLRGLAEIFAEQGFELVGAAELLPEAVARPGLLAGPAPSAEDLADARRAARIVAALGPLDVGQGAAVARGLCLAVEAIEGTDILLERLAALPPARRASAPAPSGALYKGRKPGQDSRLDLPAIGPRTLEKIAAAGLKGVALEAGGALILEAGACLELADRLGLFVYGLEPSPHPEPAGEV